MMNLNRFDLNLLVALDMLLTERSVTRAADRLCVTQPALSGSLQKLRYHFDDALLVRVGREMELTPKARALIEPVRAALLNVEKALETQATFDAATAERTFRLAMSDYCVMIYLPHVMRLLAQEAPQVRVVVENVLGPSFNRLEGGDIDLLITHGDRRNFGRSWSERNLSSKDLFSDTFVCVVAEDHPAAGGLSREAFNRYPHALVDFGANVQTVEQMAVEGHGLAMDDRLLIPSFAGLLFQLSGTQLIVTVQRRLARQLASTLPLCVMEPPVPIGTLQETLIWHERTDADPAHEWFRGVLTRAASGLD